MSLLERIKKDHGSARHESGAGEARVLEVILKDIEDAAERAGWNGNASDELVITALVRGVTRRLERLEQSKRTARADLQELAQFEIEIISRYLPEALSDEELSALVEDSIKETAAKGAEDLDKVMRNLLPRIRGREDEETVKNLVMQRLS